MNTPNEFNEDYTQRRTDLEQPFSNRADPDVQIQEFRSQYTESADDEVTLAGRLTRVNDIGSLLFADIRDETGVIQLVLREGADRFEERDILQTGDYIQATGTPTTTNTGEFSLEVTTWEILTPASRDAPFRTGLSDQQQAHDRVGAMLVDDELRDGVRTRFDVQNYIRDYLREDGFQEVQTPILHDTASGAAATPFETHAETTDEDMALRVAPELYLKRLVMSGFENIFEIGPNFRNEDADTSHNPEFTMMELYSAYGDYEQMMELTEQLIESTVTELTGGTTVEFDGTELDFSTPWERRDYLTAIETEVDHPVSDWSDDRLLGIASARTNTEPETRMDAYEALYDEYVEPTITDPVFITGHPRESTPLCASRADNPERLERFEAVAGGMELANAYSELTDPLQQQDAFEQQGEDDESYASDRDYVESLGYGLPPTGGLGIGLDRLAMIIAGETSIRRVLPFPLTSSETPE